MTGKKTAARRELRWLRLDNAAKIYPAARRSKWSNVFRLSATLTEPVDVPLLQAALETTVRRFPSVAARLRKGLFWYYLQELERAPAVGEDGAWPLRRMGRREMRRCAFRVLVYRDRIALELFHALTDGTGAMIFLKSLLAEYIERKYGLSIPAEKGVLDRQAEPEEAELEDSFLKYAGPLRASRKDSTAWHLSGTPSPGGFQTVTCFQLSSRALRERAKEYGVSVTAFLCAALMQALLRLQRKTVPSVRRQRPVKVLIPVNLRQLFPSRTLRNFAMYTTPEIDPRLGDYSFEEICRVVRHRMGLEITAKHMSRMIATNVSSERMLLVRVLPLVIKNLVMKAVFEAVGECKSCLTLSNLGAVELPEGMGEHVRRMDFILGVQASAPHNCGVLSWGDTTYINFIRNIRESGLEYEFFRVLQEQGLPVQVQSNRGRRERREPCIA